MKIYKVAFLRDTSRPMLGLHGLHLAFRGLPNVDIVAHVDSNPDNISDKLALTQARRHYLSYTEMLDHAQPDIVVLCSRHPHDHFPQISEAVERGIHIYCEKPLTVSLEEADRIVEMARRSNVKICMAHPARYALAFRTMKEMILAGEIGTPLTAYGRGKCDHRGGGEDLIVLGTHILDLQAFIFGQPESVWAQVRQEGKPVTRETRRDTVEPLGPVAGDEVFGVFNFPQGVQGIFESRKGLFDQQSGNIYMGLTVTGSKGALSMRFNDGFKPVYKLRISRACAPVEDHAEYVEVPLSETREIAGTQPLDYSLCGKADCPREPFFLEANRFAAWDLLNSIKEDRLPISNIYNARQTIEMIYGIYESQISGTMVALPPLNRSNPLL